MLLSRRAAAAPAAGAAGRQQQASCRIQVSHAHRHQQQQHQQQHRQQQRRCRVVAVRASAADTAQQQQAQAASAAPQAAPSEAITLTERALAHLLKLRQERAPAGGEPAQLIFRVGVKQGGCSGLSYVMDWEDASNIKGDDYVVEAGGGAFKLAVDPKSLLYIFGMQLDYSDALIGGGFQMINPNATDSCGCGKSFGV